MKVFSNVAPQSTDRVVQTVGKQNEVIDAIREVISLTRETPIKGPVHNYDPLNYDRMYADEYGGYGNIPGSSRPSRDGGRRSGGGDRGDYGRSGGRSDDRSRSGGRRDNPFVNPWATDDGGFNGGGGNAGFGGGSFGGNGGFGGNSFGGGGGGGGGFGNAAGPMGGNNFGSGFGSQGGGGFGGNNAGGFGGGGFGAAGQQGGFGGGMQQGGGGFGGGPAMGNGMGGPAGTSGFGANGNVPNNITGALPEGHDPKNSTQVSIPKDVSIYIDGR